MLGFIQKFLMVSMMSSFRLYSDAFKHAGNLPKNYTADGMDVNPPLKWDNPPNDTKSFALIVDDPDAPHGVFTHWLVKDIPAETREIPENSVPGVEVTSSWKEKRWRGPKPPSGTHRYFFKLYALNTEKLKANNLTDFYKQVEEHKIDEAVLMGKYSAHH